MVRGQRVGKRIVDGVRGQWVETEDNGWGKTEYHG